MNRYSAYRFYLSLIAAIVICLLGGFTMRAVAQEQDTGRPTLGDLMLLTQLRHFKLWYAQKVGNWPLASYELQQFKTTIDRIVKLYPTTSSIAQANLIHEKTDPAMEALRQAVSEKDGSRFEAAFQQVTNACNQCHQAAGVGFITVQVPTHSPFGNQNFGPTP